MKVNHILTFCVIGAFGFLSSYFLMADHFQTSIAYFMAMIGWVAVASFEYQERVFERAIKIILKKYGVDKNPDNDFIE